MYQVYLPTDNVPSFLL